MSVMDLVRHSKNRLVRFLGRRDLVAAAKAPTLARLESMRSRLGIQLSGEELLLIAQTINAKARPNVRPNVLVYGTGKDSEFWYRLNASGQTLFLEDDLAWVEQASRVVPHLSIRPMVYGTSLDDWRDLLNDEPALRAGLPDEVRSTKWDVILVDAPRGHEAGNPGRMKSIYHASILATAGTDVFVHDCNREVEAAYCDHFLTPSRLQNQVRRLRHYQF